MNQEELYEKIMLEISSLVKKYIQENITYEYIDKDDPDYIDISDISVTNLKRQYVEFAKQYIAPEYGDNLYYIKKKKVLTEGVDHTEPVKYVEYVIKQQYMLQDWQVWIYNRNHVEFVVIIPDKGNNEDMIIEDMTSLGYFVARKWYQINSKDNQKYLYIKFDPKYQKNETDNIRKGRYLYHVSPVINHNSIMNHGFVPLHKNKYLGYPPRVYLFKADIMPNDLKDIVNNIDAFKTELTKHDYTIYLIDLNNVSKDILFYNDCNYEYGVFTEQNIPYDSVIGIKVVNINDPIKEWIINIPKRTSNNIML